jgi:dTDP-6-deoxy-L-talose 4-dehydrogenase (NAD+)
MKVAVTGASGFIGRYVLKALNQYDIEIVAVTRDKDRLADWAHLIEVVEFDMSNMQKNSFLAIGSPDVLIHLAWDGLPNYKSLHHFETELTKQYSFLKGIIEGGLKSVLVSGTCFEYGMQSGCLEEDFVTQPNNPYGFAKDSLRKQLEFLKAIKPFNLTWARLFYMFGEGQPKSAIYSQLKSAVSQGDEFFNMSGGKQLRDYLHVGVVANLIVELALQNKDIGVVNISSGKSVTIKKIVEDWIIENRWDIQPNYGFYPYPEYEPMEFWGSRKKLDFILHK